MELILLGAGAPAPSLEGSGQAGGIVVNKRL